MSGFLISVLAVGVILGFMILIHEFGHYAVAKLLGVRVEVFSIGFGKRLIGFRKGETDYRIAAIPLGGYVKMSGENPMDQRTDDPAEFMNHPRWHRFLIAIAGPAMNIALSIGLLAGVYKFHYEYPAYFDSPTTIGWISKDSAAEKGGLQVGDRIVKIDGIQNPGWEQIEMREALSPSQPLEVAVERNGQIIDKTIVPDTSEPDKIGVAGWAAKQDKLIVTDVTPDKPAEKAGIKEGDEILTLDGKPLTAIGAMVESLKVTQDKPIALTVLRDGQQKTFTIQPVLDEKHYRIGIASIVTKTKALSTSDAFNLSIEQNKKYASLILELVKKMVSGKMSVKSIEGPIRIGQAAGEAAQRKGWTPLLGLTAAISLNLGVFNLLPIPILDGGVIMLLFIEGLMRRDISMAIKERVYQVAFVFLVLFAAMVIFNDLAKTLPGMLHHIQ
jgi:regulator of sigma E protease